MICLVYGQSSLWNVTIIFYTCIWIPFLQIKYVLREIVGFVFFTFDEPYNAHREGGISWSADFGVATKFKDLNDDDDVMCSVCLAEFEKEDVVSQLPKCGHVFHMKCIQSWLDRNHFTCPLCRSNLLLRNSCPDALPCKMWPSIYN